MNLTFKKKKRAFTLVEVLIVIAIIGILFIVLVSRVDFATDKAKTSGVQADFRSFQSAFETVSREYQGFNMLGWDTGDANGDRIRNSYDKGDINKNDKVDGDETWVGRKEYAETWTGVYTLDNPANPDDKSAYIALENAINTNLDPTLHITINPDTKLVTMKNGYRDAWQTEYHGIYLSNAMGDGNDRGAILMYSNGPNKQFGSDQSIEDGKVTISLPGNNKQGQDDMSILSVYTYRNGYGESMSMSTGFSENQNMLSGGNNNNVTITPPSENVGIQYEMLNGVGQTFVQGVDNNLTFRSEADYDKFLNVKVDGVVVDPSNYNTASGSTIVMLKDSFLSQLNHGTHVMQITSNDGQATTSFEVDKLSQVNNDVKTNVTVNGHVYETTTHGTLYDLLASEKVNMNWVWGVSEFMFSDADIEWVYVSPTGRIHNLKEVPLESNGVYTFSNPIFGKTIWDRVENASGSPSSGWDMSVLGEYKTIWVDFGAIYTAAGYGGGSYIMPVFAGPNETYQDIVYHSVLRWYRPEPDPRKPAASPATVVDDKMWVLHPGYKGFGTTIVYIASGIVKNGQLQDLNEKSIDGEHVRIYCKFYEETMELDSVKQDVMKVVSSMSGPQTSILKYNTVYHGDEFELIFYNNGGFAVYNNVYGEGFAAPVGSVYVTGYDIYVEGNLMGTISPDGSSITMTINNQGETMVFVAGLMGTTEIQKDRWYVSKDGVMKYFIASDGTITVYNNGELIQTLPGSYLYYEGGVISAGTEAGYLYPDGNKIIFGEQVFFLN